MKEKKQIFWMLLSHEMFGSPLAVIPDSTDWNDILALGQKHAVSALLYPVAKECGDVPTQVMNELRNAAMLSLVNNEKLLYVQDQVISALSARNIPYAILKGASVACCYLHSELRVLGDIDVLVDERQYDAACTALTECGFSYIGATDMHGNFEGFGASVEVHRFVSRFPDTEKGRYAQAYMANALLHTKECTINESRFPILDCPQQMIALLAHLERHMGTTGIGLRQVCDWAMTVHVNRKVIDEKTLQLLDDCGFLHFARIMTRLCEKYLGLPPLDWSAGVTDKVVDAVLEEIMDAGNFTEQCGERAIEGAMINAQGNYEGNRKSLFHNYTAYVRRKAHYEYPWARSVLWQPLFWIYYPILWMVRVMTGSRKAANPLLAVKQARIRERLIQQLKLYQ